MMRFLLVVAFALTGPAGAEPSDIAAGLAAREDVPGAVAGWVTEDDMGIAVAGLRQVEGDPMAETDPWHVGSLTKSMTATLAARMVEAGLITWETRLGDRLEDVPAIWRDVTLEMLLRHASGLRANLGRIATLRLGDGPRADYVALVLGAEAEGEVGGYLYSNAGYVVAGAMLEAAGDAPWEDLIARHVFEPLGIESAGIGPPQGDVPEGHRPRIRVGLRPVGQGEGADNIAAMGPAGRVHLSGADMLLYLRAHLTRDPDFLSEDSWDRLQTAQGPGRYALGWVVADDRLIHDGSNTFWYALAEVDRGRGVAGFVAINSGDLDAVQAPVVAALGQVLAASGH